MASWLLTLCQGQRSSRADQHKNIWGRQVRIDSDNVSIIVLMSSHLAPCLRNIPRCFTAVVFGLMHAGRNAHVFPVPFKMWHNVRRKIDFPLNVSASSITQIVRSPLPEHMNHHQAYIYRHRHRRYNTNLDRAPLKLRGASTCDIVRSVSLHGYRVRYSGWHAHAEIRFPTALYILSYEYLFGSGLLSARRCALQRFDPPVRSTNCLAPSNDHTSPLEDTANNYSSSSVAFSRRLECLRTILGANLQSQIYKGQKPCAQVSRCDLACFRTVRDGPPRMTTPSQYGQLT